MKKAAIIILSILIIGLSASALYIYKIINSVHRTILVDDKGNPLDREGMEIATDAPNQEETGVKNILLIGVDTRKNEKPHSDTMIIASIDHKNKTLKLTSIMRDTWLAIPGRNDNRINTAIFTGGPLLALKTVNFNFKMDIEDYITVDFNSFMTVIDEVGGVQIDVKDSEIRSINREIAWHNFISDRKPSPLLTRSGLQTLDGCQALSYSRIRDVGNYDWERTSRQRKVLNEIFKKGKDISVTKVPGLINKILPNVDTSLSNTELIQLGISIINFRKNEIEEYRIPANNTYTDEYRGEALVIIPDIKKNTKLLHEFIYG